MSTIKLTPSYHKCFAMLNAYYWDEFNSDIPRGKAFYLGLPMFSHTSISYHSFSSIVCIVIRSRAGYDEAGTT